MSFRRSITAFAVLICAGSFAALVEAQPAPVSDAAVFSKPGVSDETFSLLEPEPSGVILEVLGLFGVSPTGNPAQYGNYTVLTEPDGTISDVFGVIPALPLCLSLSLICDVLDSEAFDFAFFSDTEIGGTTVPSEFINPNGGTPIFMPEGNGGPFPINSKYFSFDLEDAEVTGTFTSDGDSVPEPATLALLGIGLAGLGFSRRKRKQ
jgi:hypothetical protein